MRQNRMLFGLAIGVLSLAAVSCTDNSFLDETETSDLTKDVIFSDSTYTAGFLNHIYADGMYDIYPNRFGAGGLQTACDECEFKLTSGVNDGVMFATGTVNPVTISVEPWKTCYRQIRSVNVFLANIDACPMNGGMKTIYKAEARFMRAWYYAMLLRHYGGVPLMGDVVYENSTIDEVNMKRATYAECVDYIVDECNEAAKDLPVVRSGDRFGRASAGACYALIARVKLYAASPLFNGTTVTSDPNLRPLLGYEQYDKERWKEAADAARRVIATGKYQIYIMHHEKNDQSKPEPGWGFYAQYQAYDFTYLNSYNGKDYRLGAYCGHILTFKRPMGMERERLFYPVTSGGNGNGGYPYLELCESFPMKDGKPALVDGNPTTPDAAHPERSKYAYDRMNMGENRDPRFAKTFVWNGTNAPSGGGNQHMVYTYQGVGSTSDAIHNGTRTGFYLRKGCHRDCAGNFFVEVSQDYGMLRYEDVLLSFAEATNEYYGPIYSVQVGETTVGPYEVLKLLRERAGIEAGDDGMYGLKAGMSQGEMREAIRLERRIELAIEGQRFFDVRRWMIAPTTDNATLHGYEITKKLDGTTTGRVIAVRQHVFRPAMYFFPIPYDEVNRSADLLQNPGY